MVGKRCATCEETLPVESFHRDKSRKDGLARICKDCDRARLRRWSAENAEAVAARKAQYQREHAAELREYHRAKYLRNREHILKVTRAWAIKNKPLKRVARTAEEKAARTRMLRNSNEARRRARKAGAASVVPFTADALEQRIAYYGGRCWICKVAPYEQLDHVKPLSQGGPHMLANLRPACAACNLRKYDRWPYSGASG